MKLYHNPRCSKSRAALALLQERGESPEVIEYLKSRPSVAEVLGLIERLDAPPAQLLRKKEAPYAELGLSEESSAAEVATAIAAHPVLLERPILVVDARAVIGRPTENLLELL